MGITEKMEKCFYFSVHFILVPLRSAAGCYTGAKHTAAAAVENKKKSTNLAVTRTSTLSVVESSSFYKNGVTGVNVTTISHKRQSHACNCCAAPATLPPPAAKQQFAAPPDTRLRPLSHLTPPPPSSQNSVSSRVSAKFIVMSSIAHRSDLCHPH